MRANSNNNNMNKQKAVITCVLAETVGIETPSARINYAISLINIYLRIDNKLKRLKKVAKWQKLKHKYQKKIL